MRSLPAEDALELSLAGDQDGRIAGAPRPELAGNLATGDALGGRNHFQNGKAAALAHVEGLAGNAVDLFERADVGMSDVEEVEVIEKGSAIGSRGVRSEDVDMRDDAGGSVQYPRDEMSFDAMMLAALLRSSCGVEIAERNVLETGVELIVRENLFEHELRFSVRIDGRLAMIFGNGNDFRFAIGGRGGRKNKSFYAAAGNGVGQGQPAGDDGGVGNTRHTYRVGDQGLGGEVNYR